MIIEVKNEQQTRDLGEKLGKLLRGGETIELSGDVGAGKTTFVKGVARGLSIDDDVQSPSFTISRVYDARDNLQLAHYDFYRLNDAGIMADELSETTADPETVTIIEWADIVEGVLPVNRLSIAFAAPTETSRQLTITGNEKLLIQL
ncbi:tRNA (adenosine(37)-N6)-threonylcarbamoyltransferase complex ATPase subunit type 1 TsaE [Candidatus Saccharibacteria bacterium]|nr:tRNA (adenosine(37)-N6)-threonylcarbamoyltransferase complex ATPase subunit type 1 TsaE [Candidatus Saccharibacteria bacterium]